MSSQWNAAFAARDLSWVLTSCTDMRKWNLRKGRHQRHETVEKGVRKMMEDSWDTAVDVFKVECSICGSRHFLGSAIMYRHETVKYEKGETVQMLDSWESVEKEVGRQVWHCSSCLQSRVLLLRLVTLSRVIPLRLKTLFGFCHHVDTWDSEIWERRDSTDVR